MMNSQSGADQWLKFDKEPAYKKWYEDLSRQSRKKLREKLVEYCANDLQTFMALKTVEPKQNAKGVFGVHMPDGLRIYFAVESGMIVLLCGGSKNRGKQRRRDIQHAANILQARIARRSAARGPARSPHAGGSRSGR